MVLSPWTSWKADLARSREFSPRERKGVAWFIEWYFRCLEEGGRLPGRESACLFWRSAVKKKERTVWQMEQWAEAMAWYDK
jgi:hypothetical protein